MAEKPLYEDEQIRIEISPNGPHEQIIYLSGGKEEEMSYFIPRGGLEQISRTPRGKIEDLMTRMNRDMVYDAVNQRGLNIYSLGLALVQACFENKERTEREIRKNMSKMVSDIQEDLRGFYGN